MAGLFSKHFAFEDENNHLSYKEIELFIKKTLLPICQGILERAGPFHKEGLYQSLLIHELQLLDYRVIKEMPFAMNFLDSKGEKIIVGDNQSMRTDIELIEMSGLLELKSTHNTFKDENIWQLKNYLDQRNDRFWGAAINFISKYTNTSAPKVEITWMYKINKKDFDKEYEYQRELLEDISVNANCSEDLIHNGNKMIRYWYEENIYSQELPDQSEIFFDYDDCFQDLSVAKSVKLDTIKINTELLHL